MKNFFFKNIWDIENYFYFASNPFRLKKIILHYEIFKKSKNIDGAIIECGVFKAVSLIRFLNFRDLLNLEKKKKLFGFDVFGNFPDQINKRDNDFAKGHNKKLGKGINFTKLQKNLTNKFKNFELIKGKVEKTIPNFLKKNSKLKISFLHLDLDVYEPTKYVLDNLFERVSNGGIILVDDYSRTYGATKAIDEFIKKRPKLKIETLEFDKYLKYLVKV